MAERGLFNGEIFLISNLFL